MTDITLSLVAGAPPLTVATVQDVLNLVPDDFWPTEDVDQPVLEALAECLLALALAYQWYSGTCAAQCDVDRAEGESLRALARDRSATQAPGEDQEAFRDRFLAIAEVASLKAIRDTANALLAPWTDRTCRVVESKLDGLYIRTRAMSIGTGGAVNDAYWNSFIGAQATYPSRGYEDDAVVVAAHDGRYVPGRGGIGAHVFSRTAARRFALLLPELSGLGQAPMRPAGTNTADGFHVGLDAFIYPSGATALTIYRAIADAVNRIVGHSVRYSLFADARVP